MRSGDVGAIQDEIGLVRSMLARIPAHVPFGRVGLEARLRRLNAELEEARDLGAQNASIGLLFDGEPVIGSEGIEASFLSVALHEFSQMVEAELSLEEDEDEDYLRSAKLFVTAPAHGSFGVVLEEIRHVRLPKTGPSGLSRAVTRVTNLVDRAREADLDELAKETDPDTFAALQRFARTVSAAGAKMKLRSEGREVQLAPERLKIVAEALESSTTSTTMSFVGRLGGILQRRGQFEHEDEDGSVRFGTLEPSLDPATVAKFFGKRCEVLLRRFTTTYQPSGKTRSRWQLEGVAAAKRAPAQTTIKAPSKGE